MIYPRLLLAKNLLAEKGVIFISIDDNEIENLCNVCNEIFGKSNFAGIIPYRKRTTKTDVPFGISQDYEWIVVYAKSSLFFAGVPVERKYYTSPDYPNDRWRLSDLTTQKIESQRPNSAFNLVDPKTGKEYKYNPKRLWAITKDTFMDYYLRVKIVFPDDYSFLNISIPAYRVFESEDQKKTMEKYGTKDPLKSVSTVLPTEVGMNETASKEIDELMGDKVFTFPKPTNLIKYLIQTIHNPNALILDFFSGSSTTAHSVFKANIEDMGKRSFIMIQLPEACDEKSEAKKAGYNSICDLGEERIRRAGKKIKEEAGLMADGLDIGFRVFKIDDSNMKDIYYRPDEFQKDLLSDVESNIKEDRTPEDLLFQVMIDDLGIPLSAKIETLDIHGKKVFNVEDGHLVACFDSGVTDEVITAMAKLEPNYAVLRDSSYESDSVAVNFEQIFMKYSPATETKIL